MSESSTSNPAFTTLVSDSGEATAATPSSSIPLSHAVNAKAVTHSLEDAHLEISALLDDGKIFPEDVPAIQAILKEYVGLKEKVDKLKSLLGRSAKAQRETKVDLEATQKRLSSALREIERLNQKLETLQTRPSHLDLLMDFETNFDKALLSVGQPGGEETAPTPSAASMAQNSAEQESVLDSMLMHELDEARTRIDKLESLNSAMMSRATQLETTTKTLQKERDDGRHDTDRLQMELRMAKMEAEHATRENQNKTASLEEMQIEIDLVTRASAKANVRAAKGEEIANSLKTDRQKIQELESQVQALQEWALASAEAKQLMQERCTILENKLKQVQGRPSSDVADGKETCLFQKQGSLVVGAGDFGTVFIELGERAAEIDTRFVVLRWKFDHSPSECTVEFNILKGKCETRSQRQKADYLIKDRLIVGGAGGETEGAFNIDGSCTVLWSNAKSWVRPRTVKYTIDVISLR